MLFDFKRIGGRSLVPLFEKSNTEITPARERYDALMQEPPHIL
jgi:hypothetical protein